MLTAMVFGLKGSKKASLDTPWNEETNYPPPVYDEDATYDADLHVQCPPHTTERRLVTKIDLHVIPFLCILYLLAFLDRVNIANANVFGLSKELDLLDG